MDSPYARFIAIMDKFVIKDGHISEIEIISIPQASEFTRVHYEGWDKMMKDAGRE